MADIVKVAFLGSGHYEVVVRTYYRLGFREWVHIENDMPTIDRYKSYERGWKTAKKKLIERAKHRGRTEYFKW